VNVGLIAAFAGQGCTSAASWQLTLAHKGADDVGRAESAAGRASTSFIVW
jgi:hypothetical protein